MKITFIERLLLGLTGLIGALLAASVAFIALVRNDLLLSLPGMSVRLDSGPVSLALLALIALVLLAGGIWLIVLAFRHEPKVDKSSVSVQNTEHGSVRVSVQAMDMLVKQAIGNTEGVADIKTRIVNHEDSITVKVDMTLESDVHIPNVTMLMQRSVKNFIEEYSGIAVREVTILVGKIIEVTPHPPLRLENQTIPKIIDQPDVLERESGSAIVSDEGAPDSEREIDPAAPGQSPDEAALAEDHPDA